MIIILKSNPLPTIVVVGKDNADIIGNLVEYHGVETVRVESTGKRDTLLSAYERTDEFTHKPVAFVADQEMKLFNRIPERQPDIIWTQGYNLKNDLYVDANLEALLEPHEKWRHQQVLNSTIEWFAFEVENFFGGESVEIDVQLSDIVRQGELKLNKSFCEDRGFSRPSRKLVQQIRDEYQFLLPGDFLFQALARFLNIRGRDFNFDIKNRSLYNTALEMHDPQYQSSLYPLMQKIKAQLKSEERQIYKRNQTSKPQNAHTSQLIGKSRVKVGDRVNAKILKMDKDDIKVKVTVQLQASYKEVFTFEFPDDPGKLRDKVEVKVISIDGTGKVCEVVPLGHQVSAEILKKDWIEVTVRLQTDYKEEIVFERPHYREKVGRKVKLKVMDTDNTGRVIKVVPVMLPRER